MHDEDDLFTEAKAEAKAKAEATPGLVYADLGHPTELENVGELDLPSEGPPTELYLQHQGWTYIYRLHTRYKED